MERTMWTDERLDERFNGIDRRFDAVDKRFDDLERRMELGLIGSIATFGISKF
jgi:hypothetical protein